MSMIFLQTATMPSKPSNMSKKLDGDCDRNTAGCDRDTK